MFASGSQPNGMTSRTFKLPVVFLMNEFGKPLPTNKYDVSPSIRFSDFLGNDQRSVRTGGKDVKSITVQVGTRTKEYFCEKGFIIFDVVEFICEMYAEDVRQCGNVDEKRTYLYAFEMNAKGTVTPLFKN